MFASPFKLSDFSQTADIAGQFLHVYGGLKSLLMRFKKKMERTGYEMLLHA